MPERYLVYNAGCRACTVLAKAIKESSSGRLEIIDINGELARTLLDRATYPRGWKFRPYLVEERQDRVEALTDWGGAIRLGWLLGFKGLWCVLSQTRKANIRFLPRRKGGSHASPRLYLAIKDNEPPSIT